MARPRFEFSDQLPPAYAALLWDVFFAQRGRGLSLEEHFPWIAHPPGSAHFATLRAADGALLAGLAIRPCSAATAAVGLVCVHPAHRGQGLSTQLLQQALREVDALGYAATTLWTGKPAVYEGHGFLPRDEGLYGAVSDWAPGAAAATRRWPDAAESSSRHRGLPAYAHHGLRVGGDRAEALLLQDPLGMVLAEWQGDDADVIELLAAVLPRRWRLNALVGDTLPATLVARGATLALSPTHLQMWRPRPGCGWPALPRLRLLDRI